MLMCMHHEHCGVTTSVGRRGITHEDEGSLQDQALEYLLGKFPCWLSGLFGSNHVLESSLQSRHSSAATARTTATLHNPATLFLTSGNMLFSKNALLSSAAAYVWRKIFSDSRARI